MIFKSVKSTKKNNYINILNKNETTSFVQVPLSDKNKK